jgi:hypothetical protein
MSLWLAGVVWAKVVGVTMDHLLLNCEIASALWSAIFSRIGLAWVMSRRIVCRRWVRGSPQSVVV